MTACLVCAVSALVTGTVLPHHGVRLLPAVHGSVCRSAPPRLAWAPAPGEAGDEALGDEADWGAADGLEPWGPTGADEAEGAAASTGSSWADEGGWGDAWSDDDVEQDGDPTSSWLSPVAKSAPAPPPPPRRPIEAVKVGLVSGPLKRRNGYHVEIQVLHKGRSLTSSHRLWVSHETLGEVAAHKGREECDLVVGDVAEAVFAYLQAHDVDLADPDWGVQDDRIPYSHEHSALRTLFNYYDGLKGHLAEVFFPGEPLPPEQRPWGENDFGEPTPRQEAFEAWEAEQLEAEAEAEAEAAEAALMAGEEGDDDDDDDEGAGVDEFDFEVPVEATA